MKPLVSVVILNWNGKKHLQSCLQTLQNCTWKPLEVIVVDNNSSDGSVELVRRRFPLVKVLANTTNRGYSGGNNDGINASRGTYVCILNNDTHIDKNFLEPLVDLMEKDPTIGCCQPKLVYGDDHRMLNAVGSYLTSTGFLYHYGYRKPADEYQYNQRLMIYSAKGAAMLLRKNALDRIGLFDEDFFIYFEETDVCHRLWLAGYKVVYEPTSTIYHYEAVDTHKQMSNVFIMYLSYRNRIASFIKTLSLSSLIRLLPVVAIFYLILFIFYFVRLEWQVAFAIIRSIIWNIGMLPTMVHKRRKIQEFRNVSDAVLRRTIWHDPPIVYYYYLFIGLQYYRYEPSLVETNRY